MEIAFRSEPWNLEYPRKEITISKIMNLSVEAYCQHKTIVGFANFHGRNFSIEV